MSELQGLLEDILRFRDERDWEQFHTPKNLSMAIAAEVGELNECFQWLTPEQSQSIDTEDRQHVAQEIADVGIYLLRLCQVLDIDLLQSMADKIEINAVKYPVEKAKGSAAKYDSFD